MIMGKRLHLLGLLVLALFLWGIIMFDQRRMIQFVVNEDGFAVTLEIDNKAVPIYPWYDQEKGLYYFFLPACTLDRKLYFDNVDNGNIMINNSTMGRMKHLIWEQGEIYTFEINGDNYQITFMKSEKIPAFFMETDSGNMDYVHADKHNEEKGSLMVVDADRALQYQGVLDKIKMRGNTTVLQDKKPYGIELAKPTALCGMDSGRNWKLLALYFEYDKIHTKLIFDMAREIGLTYTPDSTWVDLYCNGEYQGLYLLTQSVTANLDNDDGYLIEKTNKFQVEADEVSFSTDKEYLFKMKKPAYISAGQTEELAGYIQEIETLLVTGDKRYREYIDIDSLAKQFLIDKIVQEGDAMGLSTFFYIKDGIVYAGPLWDYDRAMGGRYPDYETPIEGPPNWMAEWYMALYQDEDFFCAMQETYRELLPYFKRLLQEDIDKYVETVGASVAMDNVLMATYTTSVETSDLRSYTEYESYIRYLKYFLANRLNYLNRLWGISDWGFEIPISTGAYHRVTFQLPDGTVMETREVMDGLCIDELPKLDETEYIGWHFLCREGGVDKLYSSKIPIYEDMVLYAKKQDQ